MFLKKVELFFLQIIFLVFLNRFDVLVLIKNKFKKNIILIYFQVKYTSKNNHYYNSKFTIKTPLENQ
jgi:hypothetical protein